MAITPSKHTRLLRSGRQSSLYLSGAGPCMIGLCNFTVITKSSDVWPGMDRTEIAHQGHHITACDIDKSWSYMLPRGPCVLVLMCVVISLDISCLMYVYHVQTQ